MARLLLCALLGLVMAHVGAVAIVPTQSPATLGHHCRHGLKTVTSTVICHLPFCPAQPTPLPTCSGHETTTPAAIAEGTTTTDLADCVVTVAPDRTCPGCPIRCTVAPA